LDFLADKPKCSRRPDFVKGILEKCCQAVTGGCAKLANRSAG
jgi:hypothetical protein